MSISRISATRSAGSRAVRRLALAGLLLLAAAAGTAVAGEAEAFFGRSKCDPTDNDRAEASRVLRGVKQRLDVMEANIVEALRLSTGQVSGYIAQNAKTTTQALDAQTKLIAQISREVEETRSVREHRPAESACDTITGLSGLGGTRRAAESAADEFEKLEGGRVMGDRGAVSDVGGANNEARFDDLLSKYCHPGRAGQSEAVCTGSERGHGADLRPANLLETRTFANREELDAAVELSRNLAAPVVFGQVPFVTAETADEKARVLYARALDARTALSADYMSHARSLRYPGAALGGWVAELVPGEAGRTGEGLSRYELLEILASRRFEDPNWFLGLQGMGEANLLREMVTLQAIGLMLQWEEFRLSERRGAIDATSLSVALESARGPLF